MYDTPEARKLDIVCSTNTKKVLIYACKERRKHTKILTMEVYIMQL